MGYTSESHVEQLTIDMDNYNFVEIYTWLIGNFEYGAWSVDDFKSHDCRWGWEGTGSNTKIFFKYKEDKLLFALLWV